MSEEAQAVQAEQEVDLDALRREVVRQLMLHSEAQEKARKAAAAATEWRKRRADAAEQLNTNLDEYLAATERTEELVKTEAGVFRIRRRGKKVHWGEVAFS